MANYRNFWVTWADTKSVSLLCSLEHMQKSIALKALQCLCPHVNSIFFPSCYSFTYQGSQMLSWGSLPMLHHQRWTDVKTLQSTCWETELIQEPYYVSQIFTHICTYSPMHIVLKEQLLQGEPSPQTDTSRLLPPAHTFCLPPSVRWTKFQGRPNILFVWTYPRTELDHQGIPAKPVKRGVFGGLLSPLTWCMAVHCMWKNNILLDESWSTLLSHTAAWLHLWHKSRTLSSSNVFLIYYGEVLMIYLVLLLVLPLIWIWKQFLATEYWTKTLRLMNLVGFVWGGKGHFSSDNCTLDLLLS